MPFLHLLIPLILPLFLSQLFSSGIQLILSLHWVRKGMEFFYFFSLNLDFSYELFYFFVCSQLPLYSLHHPMKSFLQYTFKLVLIYLIYLFCWNSHELLFHTYSVSVFFLFILSFHPLILNNQYFPMHQITQTTQMSLIVPPLGLGSNTFELFVLMQDWGLHQTPE